jgi:hypothetical protein
MTNEIDNPVIATLAVAFYTLQNASTQLTVASILAPAASDVRAQADAISGTIEEQTAALATLLDELAPPRTRSRPRRRPN